jgi:AcrR family transcriptional regulator
VRKRATKARGYETVRDARQESIIDAAERVFLQVDFPSATMSAIALEAGISRPTLYKYFPSMDDLALAVEMRALEALFAFVEPHIEDGGLAIDRLESILRDLVAHFEENKVHLRFSGLFDHYYHDSYPSPKIAERYASFLGGFDRVETLVEVGKLDGSIRDDIDAHNTAYLASNVFLAFMQRMASRGDMILREQRVGQDEQFESLIAMVLSYAAPRAADPRDSSNRRRK